ncbi:MAG: hypothetical protein K2K83_00825 [Rikenella sp.]|nr:hypothetical protein [Rikenella sp.]
MNSFGLFVGVALFVSAVYASQNSGAPQKDHPNAKSPRLLTTAAHAIRSIAGSLFGTFSSEKVQYPPVAKHDLRDSEL